MRPALLLVGAALLFSGCGAGGLVTKGDKDAGKKLFQQKCAGCHALAAAGASGTIGPNLDDSFAEARLEGYKESAIADIVAGQIRYPGQYATGSGPDRLQANMTDNLVHGRWSRAGGAEAARPRAGTGAGTGAEQKAQRSPMSSRPHQ